MNDFSYDIIREIIRAGNLWAEFYYLNNHFRAIAVVDAPVQKCIPAIYHTCRGADISTESGRDYIDWAYDRWNKFESVYATGRPAKGTNPLIEIMCTGNRETVEYLYKRHLLKSMEMAESFILENVIMELSKDDLEYVKFLGQHVNWDLTSRQYAYCGPYDMTTIGPLEAAIARGFKDIFGYLFALRQKTFDPNCRRRTVDGQHAHKRFLREITTFVIHSGQIDILKQFNECMFVYPEAHCAMLDAITFGKVEIFKFIVQLSGLTVSQPFIWRALNSPGLEVLKYLIETPDGVIWPDEPLMGDRSPWYYLAGARDIDSLDWLYNFMIKYPQHPVSRYLPKLDKMASEGAVVGMDRPASGVSTLTWLVDHGCPLEMQMTCFDEDNLRLRLPADIPGNQLAEGKRPNTMLDVAISNGEIDTIDWLLDYFGRDDSSDTTLFEAAAIRNSVPLIERVRPEYLRSQNILGLIVEAGSMAVLNWLRAEYKSTDFRISEDEYNEAVFDIGNS